MTVRIRVGTASWTDHEPFYPPEYNKADRKAYRISYYAQFFSLVEVDSTFYRLQPARNFTMWADRTPDDFVFTNEIRPLSNMAMTECLKGIQKGVTVHGFRSTFSTWAHESGYDTRVIELALSHVDKNAVRAAYDHSTRLDERRLLLQAWADTIDAQREGAKVIPIRRRKRR